jgi:hypothetical protein
MILLQESRYMIRRPWLFGDANSQKSEQSPAQKGNGGRGEEMFNSCEDESRKNEGKARYEENHQEKAGRDVCYDCRMLTERDAARKGSGDRKGRQLHDALRSFTSVSMWNVWGNRSNKCICVIS